MFAKTKEYQFIAPLEDLVVVRFVQDNQQGTTAINHSLRAFEPKLAFSWHLSVKLHFVKPMGNGMPSNVESGIVNHLGDKLDLAFKGTDPTKPNALLLARTTWNGARELIYRVMDPKPVHHHLQAIIKSKSMLRKLEYRIDPDERWQMAEWHLNVVNGKR